MITSERSDEPTRSVAHTLLRIGRMPHTQCHKSELVIAVEIIEYDETGKQIWRTYGLTGKRTSESTSFYLLAILNHRTKQFNFRVEPERGDPGSDSRHAFAGYVAYMASQIAKVENKIIKPYCSIRSGEQYCKIQKDASRS